jgi:F-type H+-transporting ATPase subunit b
MDQILNQLGELVLGSVPTMVLFVLLVAAYNLLVRRPLDRVLAERRSADLRVQWSSHRNAIAAAEPRRPPTKKSCARPRPRSFRRATKS